ncbi:nitrous oxide reductase accessory protein NosL [Haloferax marisrubri]|uniref:Nitrous oxide reductase accessory protein NosL n=1 Tax=Haloferax marisrubri TaxID=1544719 RepID=A0A2P4NSI7_9EURY|nr:nitrous oxide reductase accessory protein NosL [Haloferax marisrubri]POG56091.1 nitrous oxide reductase accessory protein NosL [Haloferax marisrubri]
MHDDSPPHDSSMGSLTRRAATKAVSLGALAALAGCLGGGSNAEPTPEPVDLSGGKEDDQGGMVIGLHAGPNGQIFYRDNAPEGHDNPAWFHTLSMGLFPYYFEHREQGWEATAVYVTDYSTVDYELSTEGGDTFISTHTGADTFGDATEMTYVVESEVLGGMGTDLIPFSSDADADEFVAEHGGETVVFDDVTPEWLRGYMRS